MAYAILSDSLQRETDSIFMGGQGDAARKIRNPSGVSNAGFFIGTCPLMSMWRLRIIATETRWANVGASCVRPLFSTLFMLLLILHDYYSIIVIKYQIMFFKGANKNEEETGESTL